MLFPNIQITGEHVTQNLIRIQAPEHSLSDAEANDTWDELSDLQSIAQMDAMIETRPPSAEDFRVWFEHYPQTNVRRL